MLPLMAVALEADGRGWYPFTTGADAGSVVLFAYSPRLPVPTFRWVMLADDDPRPHMALDLLHVAQLLYLAPVAPDTLDDVDVPGLLSGLLAMWHCDPDALLGSIAADFGEHPERAAAHMAECLAVAARYVGVEA